MDRGQFDNTSGGRGHGSGRGGGSCGGMGAKESIAKRNNNSGRFGKGARSPSGGGATVIPPSPSLNTALRSDSFDYLTTEVIGTK